ncbi:hypothetical protein [Asticcacaulis sp.]|uniref:hypothetical protein n=1 Tax=Asticcacaulis sp. TaxID=1872648 RepID=UPI002C1218DB|nr:hypothetical protein [Asticcacaulis sp.]HTM83276.1 hypothetical protein [Asticcacaulis sp.]
MKIRTRWYGGHTLSAGARTNYCIPLNTLIMDQPPSGHTAGAYTFPTTMAGYTQSQRFISMIGQYNKFVVKGVKYWMRITNRVAAPTLEVMSGVYGPGANEPGNERNAKDALDWMENRTLEQKYQLPGVSVTHIFGTASGKAERYYSGYVSVSKLLKLSSTQQDEELWCQMPIKENNTDKYIVIPGAQTVPPLSHTVFKAFSLHNVHPAESANYFVEVALTWYVTFFDKIRDTPKTIIAGLISEGDENKRSEPIPGDGSDHEEDWNGDPEDETDTEHDGDYENIENDKGIMIH